MVKGKWNQMPQKKRGAAHVAMIKQAHTDINMMTM